MEIAKFDDEKSAMQNIKQRFFALRNGIMVDMLRKAGSPYRIIFGLNIPQLREIAAACGVNDLLANDLWANDSTRESRLLAPMLADKTLFAQDDAKRWLSTLQAVPEEVDILCHSLLRHTSYSWKLIEENIDSEKEILRYLALRLSFNFVSEHKMYIVEKAKKELDHNLPLTRGIALQLIETCNFTDA